MMEHINPDTKKLKIGVLLEDLHPAKESWALVHKCTLPLAPDINGICYSHIQQDEAVITCSNRLALTCMLNFTFHDWLESVKISKTWHSPHCSRLPQLC